MRWLLGLLVGFGFAMLGLAAAQSAEGDVEAVHARGWVHADEGFARLVFDWEKPVGYRAKVEGEQLIVEFDRPARFAMARALELLAPFVGAADPASTERRLVFDLSGPFRIRHFTDGPKVAIDLFLPRPVGEQAAPPAAAKPEPPSAPVLPAPRATAAPSASTTATEPPATAAPVEAPAPPSPPAAAPQLATVPAPAAAGAATVADTDGPPPIIPLRVGEHPGFSRLVFDWPKSVPYRLTRSGDSATIVFDAPGRLVLDGAVTRMPPAIVDFVAGTDQTHPSLRLDLKPGTTIKEFRDGTHLVLDLSAGGAPALPTASPQPLAPTEPAVAPPLNLLPEIAAAPTEAPPPHHPARPSGLPANTRTVADLMADAEATTEPAPAAPAVDAPAVAPQPVNTTVAMATPADVPLGPDGSPDLPVAVRAAPHPEGFTLRFQWPMAARLALFRRAGALWIVFDRPAHFDLQELGTLPREALGRVDLLPAVPAAGMRLVGAEGLGATASLEGNEWVIDFAPRPEAPASRIPVVQFVDPVATGAAYKPVPRLQLRPSAPGPAVAFTDPEVGDQIMVVPTGRAGEGIAEAMSWPGFQLIPTVQGIAIEPRGDDVEVAASDQGITIGVASSLGPSSADLAPTEAADSAEGDAGPAVPAVERLFDLPTWRRDGEGKFAEVETRLNRAVVDAPENTRDIPRVDLARFYFANGRPAEAGALVDLVLHDRQSAGSDPELLLISAASNLLLGRSDVARQQLEDPVLRAEIEAEPWRGALAAAAGQWDAAASDFLPAPTLLADYPSAVRQQLGMLAAEAAIRTLDTVGAREWLDRLKKDSPDQAMVDRLLYLDGLAAQSEGKGKEARDAWEKAVQSADPETRARAGFALVDLLAGEGAMDVKTAIGKLEEQRYQWRDDGLEFRIKHRLAQLYLESGRTRDGLGLMRQIASDFPENPETPLVVKEMTAAFRGFFATDGKAPIKPFEAVALYDEFPELTPPGAEGDKIQQGLAERYLEMDLPDRAAALLEDQVQHRLAGTDKARVGTRLAQIQMIDNKPEAAIKALAESDVPDLPAELLAERRLVEADALYRLGRLPDALAKLAAHPDRDAEKLQVRIFWEQKQWPEAANAIGALLVDTRPENLSAEAADHVQNMAVALTLAGDAAGLEALRQRFGAAMAETPNASAFQLLTTDLGAADAGDLASQLAGVARLDAFMTDYRKRYVEPAPAVEVTPAGAAEQAAATAAPAAP